MDYGILTDIDGNQYKTVRIGKQIWMCENLKVEHFSNGDVIKVSHNRRECEINRNLGQSSVYISPEDTSKYIEYGLLYNSSAILDSRKLAPEGWKIPCFQDWEQLFDFLGGKDIAGGKLKSDNGWKRKENQPPSYGYRPCQFGGSNESGFTALPSGKMVTLYQSAFDVGLYAWYWSVDQKIVRKHITWYGCVKLNYYKPNVDYVCTFIIDYLAIRCLKE